MTESHYPIVCVGGSAYERGRQHGDRARDRVAKSVEIYRSAFENVGLTWQQALEKADVFTRVIEASDADILAEMQGIADGAGFQLGEIVAVNCRTEILFDTHRKPQGASSHECTTIAVTPQASATGATIIGKNWDWRAACQESVIVLQVEQDEAADFVMVVEAGMVGRDGFNAAGIAVCGNLLRSIHDGSKAGVPVPFIRRRVLNSTQLDRALGAIINAERAASTNYIVAHESGIVIDFEASPNQAYAIYPERGLLTHANHFTHVAAEVQQIGLLAGVDSLYRQQRARDMLEPKIGLITVEDVKTALRDHVGHPHSVCRHPDERQSAGQGSMSIASIVIDLGERVMWVASGPPCSNEYQAVRLPGESTEGAFDARHASLAAH